MLKENTALTAEYNDLVGQTNTVAASMEEQTRNNVSLQEFLKERKGRTDQQLRIEEIEGQIKDKKTALLDAQKGAEKFEAQVADAERKVRLKQLKISEWELRQNSDPVPAPPDPLDGLRQQLDEEKAKEVKLEAELRSSTEPGAPVDGLKQEEALRRELADLLVQKKDFEARASDNDTQKRNKALYSQVLRKKDDLESKIEIFEARFKQLKGLGKDGGDLEKKRIVRAIARADDHNNDLRQKAAQLREDIVLLRGRIGELERRAKFVQGKK